MSPLKWELLGWSKHVRYTVLGYQPQNVYVHHIALYIAYCVNAK